MNFKELHKNTTPLLLCNVWDAASANTAHQLGFKAIGTSSGAIANMLGYEDGEQISFDELKYIVKRIVASTNLPLTVDIEAGYGKTPDQIANNIIQLSSLGIAGVNLEDSIIENGKRTLLSAEIFRKSLSQICDLLKQRKVSAFLNIRIDPFVTNHPSPVEETIKRIKIYQQADIDGIFIPCIQKEKDIELVVKSTSMPVNVMCMPELPNFERLKELGVKRISMGNFIFNSLQEHSKELLSAITKEESFKPAFN